MIASNEERSKVRIPKSHLRRCVPQLTLLDAASVAFGPRSILSDPEIPALIPRPGGHPINSSHSRSTKTSSFGASLRLLLRYESLSLGLQILPNAHHNSGGGSPNLSLGEGKFSAVEGVSHSVGCRE